MDARMPAGLPRAGWVAAARLARHAERLYPVLNALQMLALIGWSVLWITASLVSRVVTFSPRASLAIGRYLWAPGLRRVATATLDRGPVAAPLPAPCIYMLNHQSLLDVVIAFMSLPTGIRFVAKDVLKWVPFLGWYMWATGMIFIDRRHHEKAVKSLDRAARRIREGASIVVFPEGTRSRDGRMLPFKKGPFVLAIQAGVPIVPVAIEGSGRCLPSDGFRLRPATVRVRYGEPIPTAGLSPADRDDLMRRVRDAIADLLFRAGGPAPQ